ncbi:Coatomer/clathrin adaptor appendage, Ig-like subdomain-containing protein [Jimgerdemannia flammicorona]|uniref:Coatomer/clathrin adaptor appendage, Ig-like subdomain-containing protein n=1 Tax=Jimgerdemannia flammicorona TaxID=994334 RepID=A0A433DJQ0_9FUNG|nr:Coatomer/clathrin adaptor appendage, Ig-like subdomain-containing protein [Jimgerdemannia flammicorona]
MRVQMVLHDTPCKYSSYLTATPSRIVVLLDKNGIRIVFDARYVQDTLHLRAKFSNASTAPMMGLELKIAVPKSMKLTMEPQSADTIPPQSTNAVIQLVHIANPTKTDVRIRYQVNYEQNGVTMEQSGMFDEFPKPPA